MCPHYRQASNSDIGAQLHSRYNPQAEAERYINSLNLNDSIECFILIEPGRGFIVPVLQEKFPNSKIIVLHVDSCFMTGDSYAGTAVFYSAGHFASNADTHVLQEFLDKEVPDIDAALIRIIEWRPSLNYYKEAYVRLFSLTVEFLKRMDAGRRTTAAFGKRWVRNFFKNLNYLKKAVLYRTADIPVIITGSGPSLETALPVIKKLRNNFTLIASSSSLMALFHAGIHADFAIATDGGIWALKHIYPLFRNNEGRSALAANLCAALPSQCSGTPLLILNDGSLWQSIILHDLNLPSVIVPQRGTVTASAVDLAIQLSSSNIFLAGVDLCVSDIRTHVRPYSFDSLFFNSACRFAPFYSQSFIRSNQIRNGGSIDIYASWFKNQLNLWPKRIFSIDGNHENESGHPSVCVNKENAGLVRQLTEWSNKSNFFKTVSVKNEQGDLKKRGEAALLAALKDKRYAADINAELTPLLFPGEKNAAQGRLISAIKEVCRG